MASVFITGSADGLGRLAAQRLVTLGHDVVLHGRDRQRAQDAMSAVTGARTALVGDLASIEETRALAEQANAADPFQTPLASSVAGARTTVPSDRRARSGSLSTSSISTQSYGTPMRLKKSRMLYPAEDARLPTTTT